MGKHGIILTNSTLFPGWCWKGGGEKEGGGGANRDSRVAQKEKDRDGDRQRARDGGNMETEGNRMGEWEQKMESM